MVQKTFGVRKQSVIRLDLIALIHILFQTVSKGLWNGNNPIAFGVFGGQITSLPLIR